MTSKEVKSEKAKSDKPKKSGLFKFLVGAAVFYAIFAVIVFFMFKVDGSNDKDRTQFCYDTWGVFNEQQIAKIDAECKKIQKKKDLTVLVVTCEREAYEITVGYMDKHTYYEAALTGDRFCKEYNVSKDNNFAIIIINAQKDEETQICFDYHFDFYTYGDSYTEITNDEIYMIEWSDGADKIVDEYSTVDTIIEGTLECASMMGTAYKWIIPKVSWSKICLGSVIISAIISLIVIIVVRKSYTRNRKNETFSFATNSKLNLNIKDDHYIRSSTTYVRIRSHHSDGSRSGGGGLGGFGGFRGGGFSGGGGGSGHRGGR